MNPTLAIFSGLPGTGKSTLAYLTADKLQVPLLAIDDVVSSIPPHMRAHANPFWDDMIAILLHLVETQISTGLSVVVDSVFMGDDRLKAFNIAARNNAKFRPIHTYISDEATWRERVQARKESAPPETKAAVADWHQISEQRKHFCPWRPETALLIDGLHSIEDNLAAVLTFITAPQVTLRPLVDD